MKLEDGKTYKNRINEVRTVRESSRIKGYPFTDKNGVVYDSNGKVWKGKESNYDLVSEAYDT